MVACVEAEDVGGADGVVGAGDLLGFVEEVGEGEAVLFAEFLHVFVVVFGVGFGIVGHDGDDIDAFGLELLGGVDEARDDGFDIRAVVGDEGDDRTVSAGDFGEGEYLAVDVFEGEARGGKGFVFLRGVH